MEFVGVAATIGCVALFWIVMRHSPRIWELEALDRLIAENPAWAKYRDPIVAARQGMKQAPTPDQKAVWASRLHDARVAAGWQVQSYLVWQRVPRDAADNTTRSPQRMREIQEDVARSATLDPDVLSAADLALRARLLPPG